MWEGVWPLGPGIWGLREKAELNFGCPVSMIFLATPGILAARKQVRCGATCQAQSLDGVFLPTCLFVVVVGHSDQRTMREQTLWHLVLVFSLSSVRKE